MSSAFRRGVTGTFGFVRSAWMVLGITLLLFLVLETAVRVRRAWAGRNSGATAEYMEGDPRRNSWNADYKTEFEAVRKLNWRPYVYFRRAPYSGREISIDSLGHRVTPQPVEPANPVARVRMYGGSTMWGEPLRAAQTIPAEVARRLQPLAGPGARIDVANVGETGYVFSQELVQLLLDLRAGIRPDIVVFYDGINDVASAVQRNVAGDPQNEARRVTEFNFGRTLDAGPSESALGHDVRVAGTLTKLMSNSFAIVQWAKSKSPAPRPVYAPADSLASSLLHVYAFNARLAELLGKEYGFTPVYVWQPSFHITQKKLNPYEKQIKDALAVDSFHVRITQIHERIPARLDSAMNIIAPGRFVNASTLFKDDPSPVFVDRIGHNTETSIPVIVDAFWPVLSREMTKVLAAKGAAK